MTPDSPDSTDLDRALAPAPLAPLTPDVILRQVVLDEHDVDPDGRFAVVVRRTATRYHYRSHLWLVPLDGGAARPLTRGAVRDTSPAVRPDGRAIAFRRADPTDRDAVAQLHVLELDADRRPVGKPRRITRGRRAVVELAWAPDGRRIACTREAGPARSIVGPGGKKRTVRARRISRIDWRSDGSGHLDRWEHLYLVDPGPDRVRRGTARARRDAARGTGANAGRSTRPRRVTAGDYGVREIAWLPDGSGLLVTADPRPDADLRPRSSIWRIAADASEPVDLAALATSAPDSRAPDSPAAEILSLGGPVGAAAVSPDGRWVAAVGIADEDALDDQPPELVIAPARGDGLVRRPWPGLDRHVGVWLDTDLNGWMNSGQARPIWVDARTIVVLVTDHGRSVPWRFEIDPETGAAHGAPERLTTEDAACWTLRAAGRRLTALGTLGSRAMELMTLPVDVPSELDTVTTIGSAWQASDAWPEMRLLLALGEGGPIETWLASPHGAGDRALPTVVDIHGGPLGAWAPAPSLEVSLLVARGYRVVLPNIRGSAGYGRDWIRPQLGDWGGVDAADVHAALDHVIALGLADASRLGALGLSYGGFMVHWLIATSDRFAAAVSENGVVNQVSAWANSDTGPDFFRWARLGDPLSPDGVDRLWRQSPLAHVAGIRTPLLMLQAEADHRCPPADNEQLFVALRWLRREVEYVLYPEESHVYSVTGRPDRRIDRMQRMLDWFDRHLKE